MISSEPSQRLPVSVVIVNYNAGDLLTDCVGRVLGQVQEVIVVDNASSDGSLARLVEKFHMTAHLRTVCLSRNRGFAAGCNSGLEKTIQPYILFLNPDCLLHSTALPRMMAVIEKNERIGMAGGRLVNPDGSEQRGSRRMIPTPWRSFVYAFGLNRFAERWPRLFADFNQNRQSLPSEPVEVEAVSGAFMLLKRKALDHVGRWDEKYFLHCEDLDLCMRFRQKGWQIFFVPDAVGLHYQGTCGASSYLRVEWHKHKSMKVFYRKFFRYRYPGFLMWLVQIAVWVRFAGLAVIYAARRFKKGWSL